MSTSPTRRRGLAASFALLAVTLALGLGGCAAPTTPADAVQDSNGLWIVTPEDLGNAKFKDAMCDSDQFLDYALRAVKHGDPTKRDNTHAPSIPFKATTGGVALKELMAEHCGNPTVLYMTLQGLDAAAPAGISFLKHNDWAQKFLNDADHDGLRTLCLRTKELGSQDMVIDAGCQEVAEKTNVLLYRLQNMGFETHGSLRNWFVPVNSEALELPLTVENPDQESLPALVLQFTEKGIGCTAAIGYNKLDKRFETFPCAGTPKPPGKTVITKHRHPHSRCKPGQTVTHGKCTDRKNAKDDPQSKGNVPKGGKGKSPGLKDKDPGAPAVGSGGGATTPPPADTPPRDPPPAPQPGAGDNNGSVGTPP